MDRSATILIAGAGPAGLAAALYLLRDRPELAGRIVAIEKARHPRPKVCAGGLIPKTLAAMRELGLSLEVPAVEVFSGDARTEAGTIELRARSEPLCTIVRRDEFDASLAYAARRRGLRIVEQARLLGIEQNGSTVQAFTDKDAHQGVVLIGADGSGSRVRAAVFGRDKTNIGRALMADVPTASSSPEFARRVYRFDFNCVSAGIRGYSWSFPCLIEGEPHLNLGIYDQCPRKRVKARQPKARLPDALAAAFPEYIPSAAALPSYKAFPIRWYEPCDQYACLRTILVGDAAGVDPLMGEGISAAFEHGKLAAHYVGRFLDGEKDALDRYSHALHAETVGRKLRRLRFAADRFYGPRHRLYFRIAALSRIAQQLGIDWYNGTREMDQVSAPRMLGRWAWAVLSRTGVG
ncbi:MAG: FAD-dependent monooxygenase [Candidatus Binataceae bacterium]